MTCQHVHLKIQTKNHIGVPLANRPTFLTAYPHMFLIVKSCSIPGGVVILCLRSIRLCLMDELYIPWIIIASLLLLFVTWLYRKLSKYPLLVGLKDSSQLLLHMIYDEAFMKNMSGEFSNQKVVPKNIEQSWFIGITKQNNTIPYYSYFSKMSTLLIDTIIVNTIPYSIINTIYHMLSYAIPSLIDSILQDGAPQWCVLVYKPHEN